MRCDGMEWDVMGWDGMEEDRLVWNGMGWDGMEWDRMGWDGMRMTKGWHSKHQLLNLLPVAIFFINPVFILFFFNRPSPHPRPHCRSYGIEVIKTHQSTHLCTLSCQSSAMTSHF